MPDQMLYTERQRLRAAAWRATKVYPGPVGALLERELLSWEEMGWRFGSRNLIMGVVEAVEQAPEPARPTEPGVFSTHRPPYIAGVPPWPSTSC